MSHAPDGTGRIRAAARVAVCGDDVDAARAALHRAGHVPVLREPDWVLCHGGDGTLLRAEREWPGLPKLPVRVAERMAPCPLHTLTAVLQRLASGELSVESLALLAVTVGHWRSVALNDVVVRNESPGTAVRLAVAIDGRMGEEVTGDGVVLATPFGSSGYFRSITRTRIASGLCLAWNNPTVAMAPVQLDGTERLTVAVRRGPAQLVLDNDPRQITLREGHAVGVARSERQALAVGLDALRCQDCRKPDGATFNRH